MLDAAREAITFAVGHSREDLDRNRMLVLAIVKDVEIVGEAASRMSAATRSAHPEVPWAEIVGMRNRLTHAYYDVDLDTVWDTVVGDLPQLIALLEPLIEP